MKTFTYSQCNNEFVLSIKKEYKQHDNDSSIKAKYNSLIGDTYIASSHGDRHLGMGACFHGNFFAIFLMVS